MKRIVLILGMVALSLGSAWASDDGSGCGLGSMAWKGQSGVIPNVLAISTNGTFYATFAMTSGTSNCKADGVVLQSKEQEVFVAANLGALDQEMAQGQGEHVVALAALMGCPTAMQGEFAQMSQESYRTVFSQVDVTPTAVLSSLKDEMGRRPVLAASCSRIS